MMDLKCDICGRYLPSDDYITENGCIWCDEERAAKEGCKG